MSEIKPAAWVDQQYLPSLRHEWTGTILKLEKDDSETMPLYTADQLAEAVAAEREKNLAAVEGARISSDGWGDPIDDGDCERNEGIDLALEAIRSAAK